VKKNHLSLDGGLAVARRIFAVASLVAWDGEARSAVGAVAGLHPEIRISNTAKNRFMKSAIVGAWFWRAALPNHFPQFPSSLNRSPTFVQLNLAAVSAMV